MAKSSEAYTKLRGLLRDSAVIGSVNAVLWWDQETQMPAGGAGLRGDQLAAMSRIAHQRQTDPRIGELLGACESDPSLSSDPVEAANLREIRWDYERATKLPEDLVAELAKVTTDSTEAWKEARRKSDFASFAPYLEKILELNRRKAECYGAPEATEPGETITTWDALHQDFEPGMSAWKLDRLFTPLRDRLSTLIARLRDDGKKPEKTPFTTPAPVEAQGRFNTFVARQIGFDYRTGVLATSTHPFTEGIGPGDTRMTTRYSEDNWGEALGATLHEAGHALYEQGLPKEARFGEPLSDAISLGIHESQSRMWENQVGRSRAFWKWASGELTKSYGAAFERFDPEAFYRAANIVEPNFIRIESDEATYNLHIMLRFDLERALLHRDLSVKDLPGAWNERMRNDLGLEVKEDRIGCLQDVHWSSGLIGYFPTYSLGNLYAAQMWDTIRRELPDLDAQFEKGEFGALLSWLREKVHAPGRTHRAKDLCERITGKPLSGEPLMSYLETKLSAVYGL